MIDDLKTAKQLNNKSYVIPVYLIIFGVMIFAILFFINSVKNRQGQDALAMHAVLDIQLDISVSHLWLEKYLLGDPTVDLDETLAFIIDAIMLNTVLLEGGETNHGLIKKPLKRPILRHQVEVLGSILEDFKRLSNQMLVEHKTVGVKTGSDKKFDIIFRDFLSKSEKLEEDLIAFDSEAKELADILFLLMLATLFLIIIASVIAFLNKEKQRLKVFRALGRSEKRYSSLFKNMLDGFAYHQIVLSDEGNPVDCIFLDVNAAFERMIGLKAEDVIGKRCTEVFPGIEDSKFDWIGEYGKVAIEGGEIRVEEFFESLGKWFSILAYGNGSGGFAVMYKDITERKEAADALKESSYQLGERNKELNCLYGSFVLTSDPSLQTEDVIKGIVKLLPPGWQYPDITCASVSIKGKRFTTDNFIKTQWEQSADIVVDGDTIGEISVFYLKEMPNEYEGPFFKEERDLLEGLAAEISRFLERREAADALIELNEELETRVKERTEELLLSEKDALWQKEVVESINTVFREAFICEEEEDLAVVCLDVCEKITESKFGFIGEINEKGLFDTIAISNPGMDICRVPEGKKTLIIKDMLIRGVDRATMRDGFSRIVNGEEAVMKHPDHVDTPDGHPPVAAFLGVPLKEGERTIGMIGLANRDGGYRDEDRVAVEALAVAIVGALKRKRVEVSLKRASSALAARTVELVAANESLKGLDRLKSMFIASMSHELRTPLNSIIGFSGIMLNGLTGELNEEQARQMTIVSSCSNHLLSLINDIIDVSKIETDSVNLYIEEFDLSVQLAEIMDSFSVEVNKKGINFHCDAPDELIVKSDERRVKQIIVNLISNAIKFTKSGEVAVKLLENDENAEISVHDTGVGIREEDTHKLFLPFNRIPQDEGTVEGSGLGLYLSMKLALLLGGGINVESEFRKGSVFTLRIPLRHKEHTS